MENSTTTKIKETKPKDVNVRNSYPFHWLTPGQEEEERNKTNENKRIQ